MRKLGHSKFAKLAIGYKASYPPFPSSPLLPPAVDQAEYLVVCFVERYLWSGGRTSI